MQNVQNAGTTKHTIGLCKHVQATKEILNSSNARNANTPGAITHKMSETQLPSPEHNPSFFVKVKAGARKDEILSWDGKHLRVAIKAQAQDGKANTALVKFLKKNLGAAVAIKSGHSSKEKRIIFLS